MRDTPTPAIVPPIAPPWRLRLARWIGRNWARFSYARHVEPTWLEVNNYELPIADLGRSWDGLRLVQLSDLHCGRQIPTRYLEEAVDVALGLKPDLIALTGDFIHRGYRHVEAAASLVARLQAPLGVYAVLGNHDFSVRNALGFRRYRGLHRAIAEALHRVGVRVLRNVTVTLLRGTDQLHLCGLDDLWSRECDPHAAMEGLTSDVPCVVLAHNPGTWERMGDLRWDLMLSGHTHGGQVDWPGVGRIALSRRARRYAAGLFRFDDRYLYVNKGVGFGWRFRFGVRPEVTAMTLRRAEPSPDKPVA